MNEILSFYSCGQQPFYFDFSNVSTVKEIKEILGNCDKSSLTFNSTNILFDKGMSCRYGTWKVGNANAYNNYAFYFNNCRIPKSIRFKGHFTQSNNACCAASITIINSSNTKFRILYFQDPTATATVNSGGVYIDGYGVNSSILIIEKSQTLDLTFDLTSNSFPNYQNFVKDLDICTIAYEHPLNWKSSTGNNFNTYPFYLEKLELDF